MKVGEHREQSTSTVLGDIVSLMVTFERPGILRSTVASYMASHNAPQLFVFDDGSQSAEKKAELRDVSGIGATVSMLEHRGFIGTWRYVFEWAASVLPDVEGFVLLEDDLSFSMDWISVLRRMHDGATKQGFKPGAMTCLRIHPEVNLPILNLDGVEAFQTMYHGFQVNLIPRDVIRRLDLLIEAEKMSQRCKLGRCHDVYWLGLLSHCLGRTNFMSVWSWVAHEGNQQSVVETQGYNALKTRGIELVDELRDIKNMAI